MTHSNSDPVTCSEGDPLRLPILLLPAGPVGATRAAGPAAAVAQRTALRREARGQAALCAPEFSITGNMGEGRPVQVSALALILLMKNLKYISLLSGLAGRGNTL